MLFWGWQVRVSILLVGVVGEYEGVIKMDDKETPLSQRFKFLQQRDIWGNFGLSRYSSFPSSSNIVCGNATIRAS